MFSKTMSPAAPLSLPSLVASTPLISFSTLYINGQYSPSSSRESLKLFNSKDGSLVAEKVPIANEEDVNRAVKYAEEAFRGPWASFSHTQRSECLRKRADMLEQKLDDILLLDSLTTGNPVSLIPTREKNYIKSTLLYYGKSPRYSRRLLARDLPLTILDIAGWTDKLRGDYFPADDGFVKLVRHEPLG